MKRLMLCFALAALAPCAPFAPLSNAVAAPAKTAIGWPTFRQTNSKKVVPEVKAIQFLLRARGAYSSQPDGIYGAQTAAAVKTFQRSRGLKVDGIVGAATFARLVQTVKRGARGDTVRATQILLREFSGHEAQYPYSDMKVDGVFGYKTESAVRDYQNEHGVGGSDLIKVNGVVDTLTWAMIFGAKLDY